MTYEQRALLDTARANRRGALDTSVLLVVLRKARLMPEHAPEQYEAPTNPSSGTPLLARLAFLFLMLAFFGIILALFLLAPIAH